MRIILAFLALWCGSAWAQTIAVPPPVSAYGSLAVTGSSATISSELTLGTGSRAWPPQPQTVLWIINPLNSGGTVYVCPVGSAACTTAIGLPIPAGCAYGFYQISPTATIIGSGSMGANVQW